MKKDTEKNLHQCKKCGLHYKDKKMSQECQEWCEKNGTCSVEITKETEENKKVEKPFDSAQGKLKGLELKCEEYLNNWKRAVADFENYKKDEMERTSQMVDYAKEQIILQILIVADSLDLAKKMLPDELQENEYVKGLLQIKKQIENLLMGEGIEVIETNGKQFDSEFMEAVEEVEGEESGLVAEEIQRGYKIRGKVIRPAKVKVTK